jgi:hypothetical protein
MEIKTIKTTFEGSVPTNRIFIVTSRKGLDDFKDYMTYLDPGFDIFDDIVYTDQVDCIISMEKENFFELIKRVLFAMDRETKFINIPKIFGDVVRPNNTYYVSPAKNGINNQKVRLFMDKYCNKEEYSIMEKDELFNMDENDLMLHQMVHINLQTNRIITEYLSGHFYGFVFGWSLMENTFVRPVEIEWADEEALKLWEQSCKKACATLNKVGKSERMARMILPASSAYDIHIKCEFMQIYRLCQTLIKNDEHMFQYDDTIIIAKGLVDLLNELSHISIINELISEMKESIREYELPF